MRSATRLPLDGQCHGSLAAVGARPACHESTLGQPVNQANRAGRGQPEDPVKLVDRRLVQDVQQGRKCRYVRGRQTGRGAHFRRCHVREDAGERPEQVRLLL